MKKSITIAGIFVLCVVTLPADEKKDQKAPNLGKLPPASDKKDLTYEKDIKPLLQTSCLKCHGAEKPKSKYRVDSREALIKGGESEEAAARASRPSWGSSPDFSQLD